MRFRRFVVATLVFGALASTAQARTPTHREVQMCKWGAQVAGNAQHAKLAGATLWSTRKNLQTRRFSEPWMRKMAIGITEQTFASRSRLQPAKVSNSYYEGCMSHERQRRRV